MADMKFKFTIQQYQTDAVNSVINVFRGQPKVDNAQYRRDLGNLVTGPELYDEDKQDIFLGFANTSVQLDENQIWHNIKAVQAENNIKQSSALVKHMGACSLDVEMETGTGKTYVYIKTMFELNAQYGWSKFIVVVPSIAIREGVKKSFETMEEHFMEQYGKKARFFVYNSKNLTDIDNFSTSSELSVMIINYQAFNARGKDARRIRMELDAFGSRKPIDVIKANRPILILDEPQKMGGEKTQKSLQDFNPLFVLNYSATHKERHDLVYVLDAVDAYKMQLVKKIEVKGVEVKNLPGANGYIFLEDIIVSPNKPPMARLEFEVAHGTAIKRETHRVEVGYNLYFASGNMEQYRGYTVSEINPSEEHNSVTFTNGIVLHKGEVQGDIAEEDIRRIQIHEAIQSHFAKEKMLFPLDIKTLTLFFIDKVEHYRKYDEDGNEVNSKFGQMFEEEYNKILSEQLTLGDSAYQQYLRNIDTGATHTGYFSIDKKGHKVDSKVKRGETDSDDESAYDLILKDKEKLLSFDNPVRFIFSHSALREGWDNPNVFQICTLKHGGDSTTNKRQEVGRGLRLCVNQSGDRMDKSVLGEQVQDINKLTVITSDGYTQFVDSLQKEIKDTLYERPTKATIEYFAGKQLHLGDEIVTVSDEQARAIYHYLVKNDYIDDDGHITEQYHQAVKEQTLVPLPEKLQPVSAGVQALIQGIFDEHALDGMIENGNKTKITENNLNQNFYKKEFQTLWQYINHKYTYTVHFDSQELIKKAVQHIDEKLFVTHLQYTVVYGEQTEDWSKEKLEAGKGFVAKEAKRNNYQSSVGSQVRYDLIGKIAAGTHLTRKTVVAILQGITAKKFAMFNENPEEFIAKTIKLINEEKATMIVDDITYNETTGKYDSSIFTAEKNKDYAKAYQAKKNVQDYVFADGYAEESVEKRFAEDMDLDDKVVVYAKLPRGFQIPTPVGNYAPDWAIAFKQGTVKHIYFIAETKGSMDSMDLRPIEQAKIKCAKKLFNDLSTADVVYEQVDSYQKLLDIMPSI